MSRSILLAPQVGIPVSFSTKKLFFNIKCNTAPSVGAFKLTAVEFSERIEKEWGADSTQYCESLEENTPGKPFFDFDDKIGTPLPTPSELDSLFQSLVGTIITGFSPLDAKFDARQQLHCAERHGWVTKAGKTYYKISFRFWVSGYSVTMAELNFMEESLGLKAAKFDWTIYTAVRQLCVVGGCKGLDDDYRVLSPCKDEQPPLGYFCYLVQALAGDEISLADLVRKRELEQGFSRLARRERYAALGLPLSDVFALTKEAAMGDFFEATLAAGAPAKPIISWLTGEIATWCKKAKLTVAEVALSPARLAEMIQLLEDATISSQTCKQILSDLLKGRGEAGVRDYVESKGLLQISDPSQIAEIIEEVLSSKPEEVELYRAGNKKLQSYFVKLAMQAWNGRINTAVLNKMLVERLNR